MMLMCGACARHCVLWSKLQQDGAHQSAGAIGFKPVEGIAGGARAHTSTALTVVTAGCAWDSAIAVGALAALRVHKYP